MGLLIYMIIVTCAYVIEKEVIIKKVGTSFRFILQSIQILCFLAIFITAYFIIKYPFNDSLLHNAITETALVFLLIPAAWYPIQYFKVYSVPLQVHIKSKKPKK